MSAGVPDQQGTEAIFSSPLAEPHLNWAILDSVPVLVGILDRAGRLQYANKALLRYLSVVTEDLPGEQLLSYIPNPEDAHALRKLIHDAAPTKMPLKTVAAWKHPDGLNRIVEWTLTAMPSAMGDQMNVLASGIDVTRQQDFQHRLENETAELHRSEREGKVFSRLGAQLAGAETVEKVGMLVRFATEELWGWDSFFLTVRRAGRAWFETVLRVDTVDGVKQMLPSQRFEAKHYIKIGRIQEGEPLLINRTAATDPPNLPRFGNTGQPSMSLIFAPVLSGGEILGLLSIQSYKPNFFTTYDRDMLMRIASAVGQSVKRCQAEKRARSFSLLGHRLSTTKDPKSAARIILEAADEVLGWDASFLNLYSPQEDTMQVLMEFDEIKGERRETAVEYPLTSPSIMMRKTLMEGGQLVLRDLLSSVPFDLEPFGDEHRPSLSLMYVPIRSMPSPIGILSIQSYTPNAYDQEDLEFLQSLADHCSGALERARAEAALREWETRFRMVMESLVEGLLITDKEDVVLFANERIANMSGYRVKEIIGKRAYEMFYHLDDWPQVHQKVLKRLEGISDQSETRLQRKDGSQFWADVFGSPLRNSSGEIVGTLCTITNIESRMRSERENAVYAKLGLSLAAAETPRKVAELVHSAISELWSWDAYFLSLRMPAQKRFQTVMEVDTVNGEKEEFVSRQYDEDDCDALVPVYNGTALLTNTTAERSEKRFVSFGNTAHHCLSLIHVPIRAGERVVGILSIQSYTANFYGEPDRDMLQRMADMVGPALERCRAEEALRHSRERYRVLVENIKDGIVISQGNRLMYVNSKFCELVGYTSDELMWKDYNSLFESRGLAVVRERCEQKAREERQPMQYDATLIRSDSSAVDVDVTVSIIRDYQGGIAAFSVIRDVTERRRVQQQLQHGAFHDSLTDLPNRALLTEHIDRAMGYVARSHDYCFGLLILDLDRFKVINESLGHAAGDQLLIGVAARLEHCVRPGDMVARLGGDEFALFLDDLVDVNEAIRVADAIQADLAKPFSLQAREVFTNASIGIVMSSASYSRADDILRDADIAMYRAKTHGKGRYELFTETMRINALTLLNLENDLRHALDRRELVLFFQPIIRMGTGDIAGFEALIRWIHPERGILGPTEFIPIAEENGLIIPIGWWVLTEACHLLQKWQTEYGASSDLTMSVNISPQQFRQANLIECIEKLLEETGIDPRCLKLEITESTMMDNAETTSSMLLQLRALDIQLNIDDFGTGHSSLSYLHRFPIDALKVDRSFITDLGVKEENPEIIRSIVSLAQSLGMDTIAEGVETPDQLQHVMSLGCQYGQGFHFSTPVDAYTAALMVATRPVPRVVA